MLVRYLIRFLLSVLYMRFLFFFSFAYPATEPVHNDCISFESLFPTSPQKKMLALCMQAYGELLAMRDVCTQRTQHDVYIESRAIYVQLEQFEEYLYLGMQQERVGCLEDFEFLLAVLGSMQRICQTVIVCAPADTELIHVEAKLETLQKTVEALLIHAAQV